MISMPVGWVLVALLLGGAELLSGTFYLLILAFGAVAAAAAAATGASLTTQLVVAALVTMLGWALLRRRRSRAESRSLGDTLDAGATVVVDRWDEDRSALVRYRGANWRAVLTDGGRAVPAPGRYRIERVDGTRLILAPEPDARPHG